MLRLNIPVEPLRLGRDGEDVNGCRDVVLAALSEAPAAEGILCFRGDSDP